MCKLFANDIYEVFRNHPKPENVWAIYRHGERLKYKQASIIDCPAGDGGVRLLTFIDEQGRLNHAIADSELG